MGIMTKYFYVIILLLYIQCNGKPLIWFDSMGNITESPNWILSNVSNIDSAIDQIHCLGPDNVCTHIGSSSYITRYTKLINFTNITIEYHATASCIFTLFIDDQMHNETAVRFANDNMNKTQLCHIDEVYLYGDHVQHEDDQSNQYVISTETLVYAAGGVLALCCICVTVLCCWRFKVLRKELETDTDIATVEESKNFSGKFRALFGSIAEDNNKYGHDIYQQRDCNLETATTKLPRIGAVTSANAMRAIHLSTPGRDSIPESISHKLSVSQQTNLAANYDCDGIAANMTVTHRASEPEGEGNKDTNHGNTVHVTKVQKKVSWFPTIKREGKEDAIVVERGFQHKATKEYVNQQFNTQQTPKYNDSKSQTPSVTQSGSITQVLMAEIIGTPDYNDIV